MNADSTPALTDNDRTLTGADVFDQQTEDCYPDILGLAPTTATDTRDLTEYLARLPRRSLVLSHDTNANTALLVKTAEVITADH